MKLFGRKEKATGEILAGGENAIANKEVEGLSQGQIVRRRFFRHRAAVIALGVITTIIVFVMTVVGYQDWSNPNSRLVEVDR